MTALRMAKAIHAAMPIIVEMFEAFPYAEKDGDDEVLTELRHSADEFLKAGGTWTLADLRNANIARQAEWCSNGEQPDISFRATELAGETGEACNIVKKIVRELHGWRGSRATKEDLATEIADVVICADLLALVAGIDLMTAVRDKFNATTDKVGLTTKLAAPCNQAAPVSDYVATLIDEAGREFDAWREENDPNCELDIETAAEMYAKARAKDGE